MTLQTIDIGLIANDGTGDDLRTAFEKIINNFNDIEDRIDTSTIGSNVGIGTGIYKQRSDNVLEFRSLAGDNISLTVDGDRVVVAFNPTSTVDFNLQNASRLGNVDVKGNIYLSGGSSMLFGNVMGNLAGSVAGTVYAPIGTFGLQGDVVGRNPSVGPDDPMYEPARVDGIKILDLNRTVNSFDFGASTTSFTNPIQYLLSQIGYDAGSIDNPNPISIDAGPLI